MDEQPSCECIVGKILRDPYCKVIEAAIIRRLFEQLYICIPLPLVRAAIGTVEERLSRTLRRKGTGKHLYPLRYSERRYNRGRVFFFSQYKGNRSGPSRFKTDEYGCQ